MNSNQRILRGINIATLVLSIFALLIGGAFAIMMVSAGSLLNDPDFFNAFMNELQSSSSGSSAFDGESAVNSYDYSGMSEEEIRAAAGVGMGAVIALAVGYILLHVVGLVASILTLRNVATPDKLRGAFGWTIAAAICTLLGGSFITCACFVGSAFFISRVRKEYAAYMQGGMPGQGMPMNGYGAGYGAMPPQQQPMNPQQPMGQQPQQPTQPVAPQQGQQPVFPPIDQTNVKQPAGQAVPPQPQQPAIPQQGQPMQPGQGQVQQPAQLQQPAQPVQPQQPVVPQQSVQPDASVQSTTSEQSAQSDSSGESTSENTK